MMQIKYLRFHDLHFINKFTEMTDIFIHIMYQNLRKNIRQIDWYEIHL